MATVWILSSDMVMIALISKHIELESFSRADADATHYGQIIEARVPAALRATRSVADDCQE